jgi:hypothetical protein
MAARRCSGVSGVVVVGHGRSSAGPCGTAVAMAYRSTGICNASARNRCGNGIAPVIASCFQVGIQKSA